MVDSKLTMIEDLCRTLSLLVRMEIVNEVEHISSDASKHVDNNHRDSIVRIIKLSETIMEFLDTQGNKYNNVTTLEQVDRIIRGCLLDVYRLSSVTNDFKTETRAFYDWWRRRIKTWIGEPTTTLNECCDSTTINSDENTSDHDYRQLGWRHLTAMIEESRDHLRSPPRSFIMKGAGSDVFNGEYELGAGYHSSGEGEEELQTYQQDCRYYSAQQITYERNTQTGRTLSLGLSDNDEESTTTSSSTGGQSLWFISDLDKEQPSTVDYYSSLPRTGKRKRNDPIPSREGLKRCPTGDIPPPTLIPIGMVAVPGVDNTGSSETCEHTLARWILEEDVLANGWSSPPDDVIDVGISSTLGFLVDLYEDNRDNLRKTPLSSMGTELMVKFSTVCLECPRKQMLRLRGQGQGQRKRQKTKPQQEPSVVFAFSIDPNYRN